MSPYDYIYLARAFFIETIDFISLYTIKKLILSIKNEKKNKNNQHS